MLQALSRVERLLICQMTTLVRIGAGIDLPLVKGAQHRSQATRALRVACPAENLERVGNCLLITLAGTVTATAHPLERAVQHPMQ